MSCNHPHPWSAEEEAIVRRLYDSARQHEVERALPGRSWQAIIAYGKRLGLTRASFKKRSWTPDEEAIVVDTYATKGPAVLAAELGRSVIAISVRANLLGVNYMNRKTTWTAEQRALVQLHYPTAMPLAELAHLVGHRASTIPAYAKYIGVSRNPAMKAAVVPAEQPPRRRNAWTPEELEILLQYYSTKGSAYVARQVGRPRTAVVAMARHRNIRRGEELHTRWTDEQVALAREHWPAGMALEELAGRVGKPASTVSSYLSYHQITRAQRVNQAAPKPAKVQPRPAKKHEDVVRTKKPGRQATRKSPPLPKPAPAVTPRAAPPGRPPRAVTPRAAPPGRPPRTPNLAAQKAKRREKATVGVAVTAEFIRSLPINHAGRQAYTEDGVRGWERWASKHDSSAVAQPHH